MAIPVQITFHELRHSDAAEQYVRERVAKLETLDRRITACRIVLELPHRHAHRGEHYRVRIDLTLPGAELVVDRAPDGNHDYEDLYAAIDAAFDDASRRLHDFLDKQRSGRRDVTRTRT